MEKKISIKSLYLLLIISIGFIGLGVGSTYAVFTARAEIDNPIVFNSNLSSESDIMETIEVIVPAWEIVSSRINISNTSGDTLNYVVWYLNEGVNIITATDSGSPQGSIASGGSTSIDVEIKNNSSDSITVVLGVSSSSDSVVLGKSMSPVSGSSFTKSSQISYDNSKTGVNCNDVTCMLDYLYSGVNN